MSQTSHAISIPKIRINAPELPATPLPKVRLQDYRCPHCCNLLFKGSLGAGTVIEIRCRTCKQTPGFFTSP